MLAQIQRITGRECPRVDLFADMEDVVGCVHELWQNEGAPAACDDAYKWYTRGLGDYARAYFRRMMAVYRGETAKLEKENAEARATQPGGPRKV